MGFNRKQPSSKGIDETLATLSENLDGFLLVGYQKGDHKKVILEKSKDPACRDALTFFAGAIRAWLAMGAGNEEETEDE